jgi:protocatechuate 3,4-dioxygenase beta subunit
MRYDHLTRRTILGGAFAAGGALASRCAFSEEAAPTPQCRDTDEPTIPQMDGPFYKPRSPARSDLIEPGTSARLVELSGFVLSRNCRPVGQVLVDLWHADEKGDYDNAGFRYRGHILTDAQGRYRFRTIVPGAYEGRTRHFHVKVAPAAGRLLTTQLYFPGEPKNASDGLFRKELLIRTAKDAGSLAGRFDFVLDMR